VAGGPNSPQFPTPATVKSKGDFAMQTVSHETRIDRIEQRLYSVEHAEANRP